MRDLQLIQPSRSKRRVAGHCEQPFVLPYRCDTASGAILYHIVSWMEIYGHGERTSETGVGIRNRRIFDMDRGVLVGGTEAS